MLLVGGVGGTAPVLFLVGVLAGVSGSLYRNLVQHLEHHGPGKPPLNLFQKPNALLWVSVMTAFLFFVLDSETACVVSSGLFAAKYGYAALPNLTGTKKRNRRRKKKASAAANSNANFNGKAGPSSQQKKNKRD
jgi:hypothetical protein